MKEKLMENVNGCFIKQTKQLRYQRIKKIRMLSTKYFTNSPVKLLTLETNFEYNLTS